MFACNLHPACRWGWHLPEGAAGRGLGSRSFAHQLRTGAVVHDASYWCPVHLAGESRALLGLLRSMLSPQDSATVAQLAVGAAAAPAHHQQEQKQGASSGGGSSSAGGGCGSGCGGEVEAMLHHAGAFPQRAIGPVRIMRLPGSRDTATAASPAAAAGGAGESEGIVPMDTDSPGGDASPAAQEQLLQLCIWVHAAAAAAAVAALKEAAAAACPALPAAALATPGQRPRSDVDAAASSVAQVEEPGQCQLEVGVLDLRRLEVRGGAADRALAAALFAHHTQRQQGQGQQEPQERSAALSPAVQRLGDGGALRLLLPDPRLAKPVLLGSATASLLTGEQPGQLAACAQGTGACLERSLGRKPACSCFVPHSGCQVGWRCFLPARRPAHHARRLPLRPQPGHAAPARSRHQHPPAAGPPAAAGPAWCHRGMLRPAGPLQRPASWHHTCSRNGGRRRASGPWRTSPA